MIIKSSRHSVKFANIGKQDKLHAFLQEYNRAISFFIDYPWETRIEWCGRVMDIKNNKLDVPTFLPSTKDIQFESPLSARAIKMASGEAIGIIKSQTEKRRKQIYVLRTQMYLGNTSGIKKLQSKIDSTPLVKPSRSTKFLFANLDSNCVKYISDHTKEFDGFLKLHSLGDKAVYGKTICIPIKHTKHSNKFKDANYELMTSWMVSPDEVMSRWKAEPIKSTGTRIVGADQGLTTCLTLSDKQTTGKCKDGHDLAAIIKKMNRRKKGSKAFRRSQEHRTNYINWSINQLNLDGIKEVRLEKLFQMRKGSTTSASLGHWTYTQINAQVLSRCQAAGVHVVEQSATYRSQRCSTCGWTHKPSRKGKTFTCTSCGVIEDADVNGALNHEADLSRLPTGFWQMHLNRKGFYWLETGVFDADGQEIIVPDVPELKP